MSQTVRSFTLQKKRWQREHGGKVYQTNTLWQTNIAMENGTLEDVLAIENGDIPLLC